MIENRIDTDEMTRSDKKSTKPSCDRAIGEHALALISNSDARVPFHERLTCTIAEACEATGLGRTKLYELMNEGCIVTTAIGRRRLVLVASLRKLLEPKHP